MEVDFVGIDLVVPNQWYCMKLVLPRCRFSCKRVIFADFIKSECGRFPNECDQDTARVTAT